MDDAVNRYSVSGDINQNATNRVIQSEYSADALLAIEQNCAFLH